MLPFLFSYIMYMCYFYSSNVCILVWGSMEDLFKYQEDHFCKAVKIQETPEEDLVFVEWHKALSSRLFMVWDQDFCDEKQWDSNSDGFIQDDYTLTKAIA